MTLDEIKNERYLQGGLVNADAQYPLKGREEDQMDKENFYV